ncbi:MAG: DUF962 domain-containing protein [Rhizobacter sp.]|nr:DUF962 domain-containing protein [Burkholderiales bacterium]
MTLFVQHLSKYAAYHRDKRNVVTHFIGIPMIVVGVVILLSRPGFMAIRGMAISPALIVVAITALFYLKLDFRFGVAMSVFLAACLWLGQMLAVQSTAIWLSWGIGLFVVGWLFQFVGHYFEGKKPAFVDDIMGLAIGPIFVAAELAFEFGLRKEVQDAVEARVGPTFIRQSDVA